VLAERPLAFEGLLIALDLAALVCGRRTRIKRWRIPRECALVEL
jgi:hypothetical protein